VKSSLPLSGTYEKEVQERNLLPGDIGGCPPPPLAPKIVVRGLIRLHQSFLRLNSVLFYDKLRRMGL
jgi:hypothetical protein